MHVYVPQVTNRHSFLPFLISSIFRRPSEQLPFAHGTQACKRWHQLRLQVLDTLSRACETSKSRSGSEPVVHALVSSSAAALDICSLYAYDQLEACQHIMDAIVQKRASLEGTKSPASESCSTFCDSSAVAPGPDCTESSISSCVQR